MNPNDPWHQQQQPGFYPQAAMPYPGAQASQLGGFMTRVYTWMALALGVTGAVAMIVSSVLPGVGGVPGGVATLIVMTLGMVGLSIALQGFAMRMSAPVAFALFFLYAVLMGAWLAPVFLVFDLGTVAAAFFATAGTFGAMSLYGFATRRDLSGWGTFLMMGLIGLLIASLVNALFFGLGSSLLYWLTTYVGVIVFTGLTAYDTQRIKEAAAAYGPNAPPQLAVQGATMLYVDFINIFVYMLRILNSMRD